MANKDFEVDFSFDNKLIDQSGNYFLVKDKFGTYFVKDKNQENNYIPILRDNKIVGFSNDLPSFTLMVEEINGEKLLIDYTPYNYTAYIGKLIADSILSKI